VRHTIHVLQAAKIGADVMTAPPAVIQGLFKHVLTDKGIEGFLADWAKTGQASDAASSEMATVPARPVQAGC
jgi:transaldolase